MIKFDVDYIYYVTVNGHTFEVGRASSKINDARPIRGGYGRRDLYKKDFLSEYSQVYKLMKEKQYGK